MNQEELRRNPKFGKRMLITIFEWLLITIFVESSMLLGIAIRSLPK